MIKTGKDRGVKLLRANKPEAALEVFKCISDQYKLFKISKFCQKNLVRPYVGQFKHVKLFTRRWYLIKDDKFYYKELSQQVLNQLSITEGNISEDETAAIFIEPESTFTISQKCIFLGGDQNYCHWINRFLMRLSLIENDPEFSQLPFLVPAQLTPFQTESLQMLGIDDKRLIKVFYNTMITCEDLIIPINVRGTHLLRPACEWLRKKLSHYMSLPKGRRIYISREDMPSLEKMTIPRVMTNEDEVWNLLEKYQFEKVVPGKMSFAEQIKTFSEATAIVGPHGAGLVNLVFAPENAFVIELSDVIMRESDFMEISAAVSLRYHNIVSKNVNIYGVEEETWHDFTVDIGGLKRLLDEEFAENIPTQKLSEQEEQQLYKMGMNLLEFDNPQAAFICFQRLSNKCKLYEISQFNREDYILPGVARFYHVLLDSERWVLIDHYKLYYKELAQRNLKGSPFINGRVTQNKDFAVVETYPKPTLTVPKTCLFLGGDENYCHWINRYLMRLMFLDYFPRLKLLPIIIHENLKPYEIESLRILEIPENQLIKIPSQAIVMCEDLLIPVNLRNTSLFCDACQWLRKRVEKYRSTPKGRRIYVSRGGIPGRIMANENEVLQLLEKYHFEVIDPGTLSFTAQIQLFSEVEVIIGPHGAGLVNTVFAPEGAHVVELSDKIVAYMEDFKKIAECIPLRYTNIISQNVKTYPGKFTFDFHDYVVDIEELRQVLSRII